MSINNLVLNLAVVLFASEMHAHPLFPAGVESKKVGISSAVETQGAPAVLYNPAALVRSRSAAPYLELGAISLKYAYEHPNFDPVQMSVQSMLATLGYVWKPSDEIAIGLLVFPESESDLTIDGLPRPLDAGVTLPMRISSEESIIHFGIGVGKQLRPSLDWGLSIIASQDIKKVGAYEVGQLDPLLDLDIHSQYFRGVLAVNFQPNVASKISVSATSPVSIKYQGTQKDTQSAQTDTTPDVRGYAPTTFFLGFKHRQGNLATALHLNHERWSEGRHEISLAGGLPAIHSDLSDSTASAISFTWYATSQRSFTLSGSHIPTAWGDGLNTGDIDKHVTGVDFGMLDGITRYVYAAGLKEDLGNFILELGTSYSRGGREVSDTGDTLGYYQLEVATISGAVKSRF